MHSRASSGWQSDGRMEGDWLVVWLRAVAVGGHSGVETDLHLAQAWRVRGGRVTDLRVYESEEKALEAAGLRE